MGCDRISGKAGELDIGESEYNEPFFFFLSLFNKEFVGSIDSCGCRDFLKRFSSGVDSERIKRDVDLEENTVNDSYFKW